MWFRRGVNSHNPCGTSWIEMVGEMMMVTVGLNNQVRELGSSWEGIYIPLCTGTAHTWWGLSAVPIGLAGQRALGLNCWEGKGLNSAIVHLKVTASTCLVWHREVQTGFGTEFCSASTVSALRKNTKGKYCIQQFSVLNSAPLHLFCIWYLLHSKPLPSPRPFPP